MRYPLIDVVRGFAVLAMMAYHFGFDLNMMGYLHQNLNYSTPWLTARSLILGTFVFVSGFCMALAADGSRLYLRRLGRIAFCAALVSLGSYFMFPDSWIYFGVLHFMVVAGVLIWALHPLRRWFAPIGAAVLAAGVLVKAPVFDQPLLHWVGMMTFKPITEDYVPLFPWVGLVLIGHAVAVAAVKSGAGWLQWSPQARPVAWLGRHSLPVYMLHQPLLLALLWVYGTMTR